MAAFEKASVSYTRHYAVSSYTAMSIGGFLAGRYPSELERSGYFFSAYPDSVLMFPELLQKAGVRTLSAHAHFYFNRNKAGFHQGFDVYEILPGISADNTTDKNVTSPQHLDVALKMLSDKANTSGTFFAWFHFLDPHDMYMTHEGIERFGKKARDLYDGEMKFTDLHVGKLLDFAKGQDWGKRTAIVVTSDHGEAFGEHKMYRHGFEVWDVLVHVPLMIQAPGITPRRIDALRSSIDLAPTILELTGAPAEPSLAGRSLVPELYGARADERDVIVDLPRTSDNDRRRALIHDRYKLIAYGDEDGYALYDVIADPGEKKDIKREQPEIFEQMKVRYKERSASIREVCPKMTHKLKGKKKSKPC
jgi:arylsulfatase A-like enzyme